MEANKLYLNINYWNKFQVASLNCIQKRVIKSLSAELTEIECETKEGKYTDIGKLQNTLK